MNIFNKIEKMHSILKQSQHYETFSSGEFLLNGNKVVKNFNDFVNNIDRRARSTTSPNKFKGDAFEFFCLFLLGFFEELPPIYKHSTNHPEKIKFLGIDEINKSEDRGTDLCLLMEHGKTIPIQCKFSTNRTKTLRSSNVENFFSDAEEKFESNIIILITNQPKIDHNIQKQEKLCLITKKEIEKQIKSYERNNGSFFHMFYDSVVDKRIPNIQPNKATVNITKIETFDKKCKSYTTIIPHKLNTEDINFIKNIPKITSFDHFQSIVFNSKPIHKQLILNIFSTSLIKNILSCHFSNFENTYKDKDYGAFNRYGLAKNNNEYLGIVCIFDEHESKLSANKHNLSKIINALHDTKANQLCVITNTEGFYDMTELEMTRGKVKFIICKKILEKMLNNQTFWDTFNTGLTKV